MSSIFIAYLSPVSAEFAFCQVDASIALALALAVLCDLLQQWNQLASGLPILLRWLLGDSDDLVVCVESLHQVILGCREWEAGLECPKPAGCSTYSLSWAC